MLRPPFCTRTIPAQAGIGLRAPHYQDILTQKPNIGWFEVHSENYFGKGGKPLEYLEKIRAEYPLSLHGVGLSLGSTDPLDQQHLEKLKGLVARFQPGLISEHICWSSVKGQHLNDLIPLPYTEESLKRMMQKINRVQEILQQQILIENISSYLQYSHDTIPEYEFISTVAKQSGCGILLDVNNLYVNHINHAWDIQHYLQQIPVAFVKEIHLAGYTENILAQSRILIDTHNQKVSQPVWQLYEKALQRFKKTPTLIEWDKDIPALELLLQEAQKAQSFMDKLC